MRELHECQAEVFRRSEKRIKERKQRRNHMLVACIPLVLCITLFSAFLLPGMMPEDSKGLGETETVKDGLTEDRQESLSRPITKVTVSGLDFCQTYTNAADVLQISNYLYSYGKRGPENNGATGNGVANEGYQENENDVSGSTTDSENTGYTITLVMHEGSKTEYCLADNKLENRTTNQTYTLSQKQVNELKDLLGISH